MVENFWSEQLFDLEIPQHEGNCDACFLKNEAHLAQILSGPGDWDWWFGIDDKFQIRGRGEASYRQIQTEAPARFAIRESLVQIKALPERPDEMEPRRYRLLVAQEKKILREGIRYVPCSCEASELIDDDAVASAQGVLEFS